MRRVQSQSHHVRRLRDRDAARAARRPWALSGSRLPGSSGEAALRASLRQAAGDAGAEREASGRRGTDPPPPVRAHGPRGGSRRRFTRRRRAGGPLGRAARRGLRHASAFLDHPRANRRRSRPRGRDPLAGHSTSRSRREAPPLRRSGSGRVLDRRSGSRDLRVPGERGKSLPSASARDATYRSAAIAGLAIEPDVFWRSIPAF